MAPGDVATRFHRVVPSFHLVEPSWIKFYRVIPSFIGVDRVLLGFTGFYWVLLGFTGFRPWYRVLPSFPLGFIDSDQVL